MDVALALHSTRLEAHPVAHDAGRVRPGPDHEPYARPVATSGRTSATRRPEEDAATGQYDDDAPTSESVEETTAAAAC